MIKIFLRRVFGVQSGNPKSKIKNPEWVGVFTCVVAFMVVGSMAHAQAPFYQGKSIRLIIGSQSGSLYDGWARLTANHM